MSAMPAFFGYDSEPDNDCISDDEDSVEEFTPRLARLAADLALRGSASYNGELLAPDTRTRSLIPNSHGPTKVLKMPDAVGVRALIGCSSPAAPATPSKESIAAKVRPQLSVGTPKSRPSSASCSKDPQSVPVSRSSSASWTRQQLRSPSMNQQLSRQPRCVEVARGPSTPRAGRHVPCKKVGHPQATGRSPLQCKLSSQPRASKSSAIPKSKVNSCSCIEKNAHAQVDPTWNASSQMEACTVSSEGFTGATLEIYEQVPCGSTGGTGMAAPTLYKSSSSQCSWEEIMRAQEQRETGRASFFGARLAGGGLLSRLRGKDAELLHSGLSTGGRATIRRWIRGSISGLHALLLILDSEGLDCDALQSEPETEDGPSLQALSAVSGGFVNILGLVGHRLCTKLFGGSPLKALEQYADTHSGTSVAEVNLGFKRQLASARDACCKLELCVGHELLRVYSAGSQTANRTSRQDNLAHVSSGVDMIQEECSKSVEEVNMESETLPVALLEARNQAVDQCLIRMIRLKKTLIRQVELLERVDHYAILKVAPGASDAEVKRAYREACLKCHPDKPGGDTELFQKLQIAYTAIIEERRLQVPTQCGDGFQPQNSKSEPGKARSADVVSDPCPYLAETRSAISIIVQVADEVGAAAQEMLRSWNAFLDAGSPQAQKVSLAQVFLDHAEKSTGSIRVLGEQAVELSAALAALIGLADDFPLNTEDLRAASTAFGVLGTGAIFAASDVARGSIGLRDALQSWELAALLKTNQDAEQALGEALKSFIGPVERAASAAVDTVQAARGAETVAVSFVQDLGRARGRSAAASAEANQEETKDGDMPRRDWSQESQDVESEEDEDGLGMSDPLPESSSTVPSIPPGRISSRKCAAHGRRLSNHRLLKQLQADLCQLQGKARNVVVDSCRAKAHLANLRRVLLEILCDSARLFQTLLGRSGSMSPEKAFSSSLGFMDSKAWGGPSTLPRSAAAQTFRVAASLDPAGLVHMLQDEVWPQVLQIAGGDLNIQRRCDSVIEALRSCISESEQ